MPQNNQTYYNQNTYQNTRRTRQSFSEPQAKVIHTHHRIALLRSVVLVAFTIIAVRLFLIQIIEHDHWIAKADEQHTMLETITAKRGEIYMMDRDEPVPIVLNQTTYQIVIDPTITEKEKIQYALDAYASDYQTVNLDEIYAENNLRYAIIAKNVPKAIADQIAAEDIQAVWFTKNNQRVYPEGEFASGLLGFVNSDGLGQYGVEGSLNHLLAGKDGLLKATADVNKVALSIGDDNIKIPAQNGANIVLTVDRGVQLGVEEILENKVNSTVATHAAALIMDANTGEIITMASVPNYDPADYGNVQDASAYINQITEVPYEPASVCKSFAFSAAINEGLMNADTTYFNQGYEIVDDWQINNATKTSNLYGTITMRTAFNWSLNTGSIYALKLLGGDTTSINQQGREKLYDYYYNKFRLGQLTGIELIEAEGYIPDPNDGWGRDSTYANITFGQNLGLTMLQTATAFSAVVNGGYWRTPTIVAGELKDGTITPFNDTTLADSGNEENSSVQNDANIDATIDSTHKIEDKILSDETSATMRDLLISNRASRVLNGIDRAGYAIGGKSGTAQVIKEGAYDDTMRETVGTYIGFVGPSNQMPEYVIMVKMWGEGEHLDGEMATYLFDDVSNYLIDALKIKPSD